MDDRVARPLPPPVPPPLPPPVPPSPPPSPPASLPPLTLPDLPQEVLTLIAAAVLQAGLRPLPPIPPLPGDDHDGDGSGGSGAAAGEVPPPPPGWSTLGVPLVTPTAWAAAAPLAATCRACRSAFFAAITGLYLPLLGSPLLADPPHRRAFTGADMAAVAAAAAEAAARRDAALAVLAGGLWPALGRCTALRVLVVRLPATVGPARRSLPRATADAVDAGLAGALATAAAAAAAATGGREGGGGLSAFVQVAGPPLPLATAAATATAAAGGRRLRVLVISVAPAGVALGGGWGEDPMPLWVGGGYADLDVADALVGGAGATPAGLGGGGTPFTPGHHLIPPAAAGALVHLGWTPPPDGWAVACRGAPSPAAAALAAACAPLGGPPTWPPPLALGGLLSVELPPGVDTQTVAALVTACPHLRRVVLVRPWDGSWRVLVPLGGLPALDTLDLGGWDGTGEAVTTLLPALAGGDGILGGPCRAYRRLVLPPREPDDETAAALAAVLPHLPPTLSWSLLSRGPRGGEVAVAGLAAHPGVGTLRSLHLVNISSAGVAALVSTAAGTAVAARLTRLVLDSGIAQGRLGVARIDVAALGGVLPLVRVLDLRAFRLDGGGVPLLLWALGRAQGGGGGGGGGLSPPLSPPLTSVTLDSCMGVWALAGAARLGDPDVFPIGYSCPLPRLRRVALFGCTTARVFGEGGPPEAGTGPHRRVRAAYPAVEWVEEGLLVDPLPPLFEW
ncbi:hypothetical protein I4F81_012781 [Pyropia yezoensis]|uniref:Uncharacterized protein n=1 Tax=Pyropia yezoensis TaxID=2788 RepID=A0ACC3CJ45_PYRYE|nr:hypothetical protein I4F81_012781 [Neopyropia yezoensis]